MAVGLRPPAKQTVILEDIATAPVRIVHEKEVVQVQRVIDGDTVELVDGRRVRYIGIDTPEYNVFTPKPTRAHTEPFIECFGKQARAENQQLVEGKYVRLEQDVSDKDQYGRLLRYVFVGDVFVNDHLVRQGFARIETVPPDVAFYGQLLKAEREARGEGRGLWNKCGNPTPLR